MSIAIGSKYRETITILREGIRKGTITVREEHIRRLTCYFCGKPIVGNRIILELPMKNGFSRYSTDEQCYKDAKRYLYDQQGEISLSFN